MPRLSFREADLLLYGYTTHHEVSPTQDEYYDREERVSLKRRMRELRAMERMERPRISREAR